MTQNDGRDFERPVPTAAAQEVLRSLYDEAIDAQDQTFDPQVTDFAHILADRFNETIVPTGFNIAAVLLLYDLNMGVNGFTGEPIESDLVGITRDEQKKLLRSLPDLARIAFGDEFAHQVHLDMVDTGMYPAPEAADENTLAPNEIILEPISDAETAYKKLITNPIDDAFNLDWAHFGISEHALEQIKTTVKSITPVLVRRAPYDMPVNVLINTTAAEAGYLETVPQQYKKELFEDYWFCLMTDQVTPEDAMLVRDHMYLKAIETTAILRKLSIEEVNEYFDRIADGPMSRAGIRLLRVIRRQYPETLL